LSGMGFVQRRFQLELRRMNGRENEWVSGQYRSAQWRQNQKKHFTNSSHVP
jgi:hypothetical protein